jgi:hypothetical protein
VSHLLIGLAICAALFIYPGGACLVCAWMLVLVGVRVGGREAGILARPWPTQSAAEWLVAGSLSALVVVPLSWPADPIAQISVGGLSGLGLGGIPLSLAGLWALGWLGRNRWQSTGAISLTLAWSLGLIVLAMLTKSPGWAGILGPAPLGQELLRGGLGLVALIALPWFGGPDPERNLFTAAAWAAWLAVDLSLLLPALESLPFPAVLGSWWAFSLAASLLAVAATRGGHWLRSRRNYPATGRM